MYNDPRDNQPSKKNDIPSNVFEDIQRNPKKMKTITQKKERVRVSE